jgi:Arc/MetJ family transcription regulator
LVAAAAVACLIVATAVSPPTAVRYDDDRAAQVEELVGRLVAEGADEAAVRALVGEAVRLGREGRRAEIPHFSPPSADY